MSDETLQEKSTRILSQRVQAVYPILDKNDPHYMMSVLAANYAHYISALIVDEIDFFEDGIVDEIDYFEFDRDGMVRELSEYFGGITNEDSLAAFRDILDKVFPSDEEWFKDSRPEYPNLHFSYEDEIAFMKKPPQE